MKNRCIILFIGLLVFCDFIKTDDQFSGLSMDDLFGSAVQSSAAEEKTDDTMTVAQEQAFYGSSGYLSVVSTMSSSGVMKNFTNLLETFKSGSDVDQAKMDTVVTDLTTLFISMLSAYKEYNASTSSGSEMPVLATASNDAYRFYSTIVMLYCARLQYFGNEIISLVKSGQDYNDELTKLLAAFSEYETSLKNITTQFPTTSNKTQLQDYYKTLPTLAMNDYYTQAADIILIDVLSAMELVNVANSGLYDQATRAVKAYNALNFITSLHVAPSTYSDFASYQFDLLKIIYSVCKNGLNEVAKAITFVTGTNDEYVQNQTYFNDQYELYSDACAIFKNQSNLSSQYKQLLSGFTDANNKLNAFNDAYSKIDALQALYAQSVSNAQTLETISDLSALSNSLGTAIKGCTAIQADLTLISDNIELTSLITLYNNMNAIYYVVNMKWLWALFTTSSSYNGSKLKTLSGSLNNMNDDQFTTNFKTLSQVMQSLNDICVLKSNSYSLPGYLASAIEWINSDSTNIVTADNQNLFSAVELESVQKLISELADYSSYFVQIYNALQLVNPQQLSTLRALSGDLLYIAQKIDTLYNSYDYLDKYVSNFAVLSMPKYLQSFVSMTTELTLYVLGNLAEKLADKASSSDNKELYIESAIVCYALLQNYNDYLSESDKSYVTEKLQNLVSPTQMKVTLADQAKSIITAAQSQEWSSVKGWMQNSTWLSGLQLYQLAYEIAVSSKADNADSILVAYDNSIQDYITQYKAQVATSDQQSLDLFYLYCLLMINYNGFGSADDLQIIAQDIEELFKNDSKTGFFDQLSSKVDDLHNETDVAKLSDRKQEIENQIIAFTDQINAEYGWLTSSKLMFNKTMNPMLSIHASNEDGSAIYSFAFDKVITTVTVPDLYKLFADKVQAIADQLVTDAKIASDQKDFATAYQKYNEAASDYEIIVNQTKDYANYDLIVAKYYTARTLAEASLIVSTVLRADIKSVGSIPDVASTYLLSVYNNWTVPTIISNALGDEYKNSSLWTTEQIQTVIKMMALNSELVSCGYTYDELYTPGTLTKVTLSSSSDVSARDQMESKINSFMSVVESAMSTGVEVNGVAQVMTVDVAIDALKNITMNCTNMPIAPLVPFYGGGPAAETYYAQALLLFQPGTSNVTFGSSVYVPGNDATAAQNIKLYIAATALANAEIYLQEINNYMSTFKNKIATATTDDAKLLLLSDFGVEVSDKYNEIISILLNSSSGAVACYNQNNESDYAEDAQVYAMSLYENYETMISSLLTGDTSLTSDPTSTLYTTVLNKLNLAYQVQLALTSDSSLIADLKDKVAKIFKDAGDACFNYTTIDPSTRVVVRYYKDAAVNYNAAVTKYTTNGSLDKANEAMILEYQAHALTGLQYVANFFYIKNVGKSYTNMLGKAQTVKFDQLKKDYAAFINQSDLTNTTAIDANELTLYNNVVSMFLEGIINLNLAVNGPTLVGVADDTTTSETTSISTSKDNDDSADGTYDINPVDYGSLNPDILTFMQKNNPSLLTVTQHSFSPPVASTETPDPVATGFDDASDVVDGIGGVDTSKGSSALLVSLENGKNDALNAINGNSSSNVTTPSVPDPINIYALDTTIDSVNQSLLSFSSSTGGDPLSITGVKQFVSEKNKTVLLIWLNSLYTAATYSYINEFLGGISGATSTEKTADYINKLQTLGQLIEAEGVKMQNPADVYMG